MKGNRASADSIALRLLSFRDHSRKELLQKLISRKISRSQAEEIVGRLERQGFLDDARYARRMMFHLSKEKLVGNQRIHQKLTQKGIPPDCIQRVMEEAEIELPSQERVYRLLQLKLKHRTLTDLSAQERKKLGFFLYQRGFSWSEIQEVFHLAGGLNEE